MGKSQRLFELVTLLSGRRTAVTARTLAEVLEVSERTIYRDMDALVMSGVAVEGEAGVGYRLRPGSHLPPLMFSAEEATAMVLGLSMVRAATDPELAQAAEGAERRIKAVLSDELKRTLEGLPYHMPITARSHSLAALHAKLRKAATEYLKLDIAYADKDGVATNRVIWPLAILGWGDRWTVLGWCELRDAYRNFRMDRVLEARLLDQHFETGPEMSFEHYRQTELAAGDYAEQRP
jgi:predicted DNA-binding transcriptional regulator YafY